MVSLSAYELASAEKSKTAAFIRLPDTRAGSSRFAMRKKPDWGEQEMV